MNICQACVHVNAAEADARLRAGATQASVARFLTIDRQVLGRHVRKGHVVRGNPAHGPGWEKPEPKAEPADPFDRMDDERYDAIGNLAQDLAYAIHGIDPAVAAEHRAHQEANVRAQDWQANLDDDCPAARVIGDPAIDWLVERAAEYALATGAG